MTTVAYKDGILAADTRSSFAYNPCHALKIFKGSQTFIGISGLAGLIPRYLAWMDDPNPLRELAPLWDGKSCNALQVFPDGHYQFWGYIGPEAGGNFPFAALGSGCEIAIGAMLHGASAIEAVRYAARADQGTGPEVLAVDVRTGHVIVNEAKLTIPWEEPATDAHTPT